VNETSKYLTQFSDPYVADAPTSRNHGKSIEVIVERKQEFRDAIRDMARQGLEAGLDSQDLINIFTGQAEQILLSPDRSRI